MFSSFPPPRPPPPQRLLPLTSKPCQTLHIWHKGYIGLGKCTGWHFRMMTSSNGNIFRVIPPLRGEFTGHRWIPRTMASDAELCFLFNMRLNKRLSKQSWGWWFETPSCSLWRHPWHSSQAAPPPPAPRPHSHSPNSARPGGGRSHRYGHGTVPASIRNPTTPGESQRNRNLSNVPQHCHSQPQFCQLCHGAGHTAVTCGSRESECYKCRQKGHLARACTQL